MYGIQISDYKNEMRQTAMSRYIYIYSIHIERMRPYYYIIRTRLFETILKH